MILDADRTHLPAGALFVVRVAVTVGLAALSYRFVERPIRARPRLRFVGAGAAAACLGVALVAASVPASAAPYWIVSPSEEAVDPASRPTHGGDGACDDHVDGGRRLRAGDRGAAAATHHNDRSGPCRPTLADHAGQAGAADDRR